MMYIKDRCRYLAKGWTLSGDRSVVFADWVENCDSAAIFDSKTAYQVLELLPISAATVPVSDFYIKVSDRRWFAGWTSNGPIFSEFNDPQTPMKAYARKGNALKAIVRLRNWGYDPTLCKVDWSKPCGVITEI